jgi:hypothetical protein
MPPVPRETLVEQSVQDYLREQMFTVRDYPPARVELKDAFHEEDFEGPLDKNYLALGFNFDDGGTPAELGSDLLFRQYVIEVWVIGISYQEGLNVACAVRDSLEAEGVIPLYDVAAAGRPLLDYLIVDPVRLQRQPVPEPKPWEEFLWIVTAPVIDEYHAHAA